MERRRLAVSCLGGRLAQLGPPGMYHVSTRLSIFARRVSCKDAFREGKQWIDVMSHATLTNPSCLSCETSSRTRCIDKLLQ